MDDATREKPRTSESAALYRQEEHRARLGWLYGGERVEWQSLDVPDDCGVPQATIVFEFPSQLVRTVTVVRVLVPGLVPITFGYDSDPTGVTGFAEPYRTRRFDFSEPLFPHPFA